MQLVSLTTYQVSIKKIVRELGNAYADKLVRQDSKGVYVASVERVVDLLANANEGIPHTGPGLAVIVLCCINGKEQRVTQQQCSLLGSPNPCIEPPGRPDLSTAQRFIRTATETLGDAYADKLQRTYSQDPDQLDKVYNDGIGKVAALFRDANDGLAGSLIVCQLPGGQSVSAMTEEQCREIGGKTGQ